MRFQPKIQKCKQIQKTKMEGKSVTCGEYFIQGHKIGNRE